jgi:hypothetical protein
MTRGQQLFTEETKVTYDDISRLETYIRYAVKGFVRMLQTKKKKDILIYLDHCVVEKENADALTKMLK